MKITDSISIIGCLETKWFLHDALFVFSSRMSHYYQQAFTSFCDFSSFKWNTSVLLQQHMCWFVALFSRLHRRRWTNRKHRGRKKSTRIEKIAALSNRCKSVKRWAVKRASQKKRREPPFGLCLDRRLNQAENWLFKIQQHLHHEDLLVRIQTMDGRNLDYPERCRGLT